MPPDDDTEGPNELRAYWDVQKRMWGPREEPEPTGPERLRSSVPRGSLVIGAGNGRWLVAIAADGSITYGEGYTPDEAAVTLWETIGRRRLEMERRLDHIQMLEMHLALVAAADEAYEVAQRLAKAPEATENERFREEMSRNDLETRVHGIIEFAREYVGMRPDLIELGQRLRRGRT